MFRPSPPRPDTPDPRRRALHPRREARPHQQGSRRRAAQARPVRHLIDGSDAWTARKRDELIGSLKTKPGLRRYLRRTKAGLRRIDRAAAKGEAHLDDKWLLRTSDLILTPEDLAAAYKRLLPVERGWRDMKGSLGLRPVYHYGEDRIRAHIQACWLALLLIRVAENTTGDAWRHIASELDRMHLVTLATPAGTLAQRTGLTPGRKTILDALPEPPRFFEFNHPHQLNRGLGAQQDVVTQPQPAKPVFAQFETQIHPTVCPSVAEIRADGRQLSPTFRCTVFRADRCLPAGSYKEEGVGRCALS